MDNKKSRLEGQLVYWQPKSGGKRQTKGSDQVKEQSSKKLRQDIEKILGGKEKMHALKNAGELKQKSSRSRQSQEQRGSKKSAKAKLTLDMPASNDQKGSFASGWSSAKTNPWESNVLRGELKQRLAKTPLANCLKEKMKRSLLEEQIVRQDIEAPQASTKSATQGRLRRRFNYSVSGTSDCRVGDKATPEQTRNLAYQLSFKGQAKELAGVTSLPGCQVIGEKDVVGLKTREESSKERSKISEIIRDRLESNKERLLKNEDNQAYISRLKNVLQQKKTSASPKRSTSDTPIHKQIVLGNLAQNLSPNLAKTLFPQQITGQTSPTEVKHQRVKNKSLDTKEGKPKDCQPHKRHISMKKSVEMRDTAGLTDRESSGEKRSLLKTFLDIVKKSPPEKLTTPKPFQKNQRTSSMNYWTASPQAKKQTATITGSLKKPSEKGREGVLKTQKPLEGVAKLCKDQKPRTAKGGTSYTSLFYNTTVEAFKKDRSERPTSTRFEIQFETLSRVTQEIFKKSKGHTKSPSSGESPVRVATFENELSRGKTEDGQLHNILNVAKTRNSFLKVDFKTALSLSMNKSFFQSLTELSQSLEHLAKSLQSTVDQLIPAIQRCLSLVQPADFVSLEVKSLDVAAVDKRKHQ